MSKFYDVCVVESSYTDKEGKTKNTYRKVGMMLQHEKGGMSIKLDKFFNPLGATQKGEKSGQMECWLSVFEQKDRVNGDNGQSEPQGSTPESDVPF